MKYNKIKNPKLEIYIDTPNIEKSINQGVKRLGIASPAPAMINKKIIRPSDKKIKKIIPIFV